MWHGSPHNCLATLKKGLRFPRAENFQIWVSAEAWRGSLHPSLPPSLTALPSPLCTGVWSCFLMSSGTAGAIALSPSVVTFCTCYKAFIDPVCIHTFSRTKFMLIKKKNKPKIYQREFQHLLSALWIGVPSWGLFKMYLIFLIFCQASIKKGATDVGSSVSLWVISNARFLCILTGMLNVSVLQSQSRRLEWNAVHVCGFLSLKSVM